MASTTDSKWIKIISVLVLADVTSGVEAMMVYAALKTLIPIYGNAANVGWLVTSYLLVSAAAAAVCGRLGDLYGRKRMVLIVLMCAVVGSLISAMTTDLTIMVLGRALQGMTGAVIPLSFGIVREVIPAKRMPLAIGIIYSAGAIGAMAGLIVGGMLVDAGAWHLVFYVSAGFAAVAFLVTAVALPPGAKAAISGRIDKLGGILFAPAVAAILLGASNIHAWGLLDPRTLALLIGGTAVLLVWLRHEWRHPDPLINVRLLARPEVLAAMGCMAMFAGAGAQLKQVQMLFLQQPVATGIGLGITATAAAFAMIPANIVGIVMSPISGYVVGLRGNRFVVIAGFAFNAAAWLAFMVFNDNLWLIIALAALGCMTGNALLGVGINNAVIDAVPLDRTSEASGVLTVVRSLAHAVGAQVIMIIIAGSTISTSVGRYPSATGYMMVFGFIATCCIVGMVFALRLRGGVQTASTAIPASPDEPAGRAHA